MTILPVDHNLPVDFGHKVGPIVFILGNNIAKYQDMPIGKGRVKLEIRNGRQGALTFLVEILQHTKNLFTCWLF